MPIYANKTYEFGFFNNRVINGQNDRVYNARQLKEFYGGIFTDGVKPNGDGTLGSDLAIKALDNMNIYVSSGRGLFNGCYCRNKTNYNITLNAQGVSVRYDCVIIKVDETDDVRDGNIYIKSLTHVPTVDDLERTADVMEYCLGYVQIDPTTTKVTQSMITDTRINQNLCGIITGQYNQLDGESIYAQWQNEFDIWLDAVKDELVSTATITRYYQSLYVTTAANEQVIPIGISQFKQAAQDGLLVYINGLLLTPVIDYTIIDDTKVRLSTYMPEIGTKIEFNVVKSIDGAQSESVVQEVRDLQNQMTEVEKITKYDYICNGKTDNIEISNIALEFLNADETNADYGELTISVHGTFGAGAPYSGAGSSSDPYKWFNFLGSLRNRKVIIDFGNCSFIRINCAASTTNVIFFAMNIIVKNCNLTTSGATSVINLFSTATNTIITAEDCRFWITGANGCSVARSGTFTNCRVSLTNIAGESNIFDVGSNSLLRLYGGEYYSYTGTSSASTAVVYVASNSANGVAITYAINCPTVARGGYKQSHAIRCLSNNGKCSFTDTITTLSVEAAGQNVRGTIVQTKEGMN